jgi:hypothetical protein
MHFSSEACQSQPVYHGDTLFAMPFGCHFAYTFVRSRDRDHGSDATGACTMQYANDSILLRADKAGAGHMDLEKMKVLAFPRMYVYALAQVRSIPGAGCLESKDSILDRVQGDIGFNFGHTGDVHVRVGRLAWIDQAFEWIRLPATGGFWIKFA